VVEKEDLTSNWHERPDDGRRGWGGHMMECDPRVGADPDLEKKNAEAPFLSSAAAADEVARL
jgi:hypothetical protein